MPLSGHPVGSRAAVRVAVAVSVVGAALAVAPPAAAYSYESVVTDGCHESISAAALRAVRQQLATAAPLPSSGEDPFVIDDVAFSLPSAMGDIGGVALLLGARDNDVKGLSGTDTSSLAMLHGNPETQHEHCLRAPAHDEPDGTEAALTVCRGYIRERAHHAISFGLSSTGWPDPDRREPLTVTLAIRGRVELWLPTFYLAAGQGLHALQDAFTHTFRTSDGRRVTVVLNWADVAAEDHDEPRDGPPHMSELDRCDDPDALRTQRRELATQASTELLRAMLDPTLSVAAKHAAIETVLDRYTSYQAGCTYDNRWCDAPENEYRDTLCACRAAGRPAGRVGVDAWALGALAAGSAMRRRRRRDRAIGDRRWRCVLLVLALGLSAATSARAEPSPGASAPAVKPVAPAADGADAQSETARSEATTREMAAPSTDSGWDSFGLHAAASAALDNGAFAFTLGGRYAASERWLLGLDAEYNPWFSVNAARFARGAFNGYTTFVVRWPVSEALALRTTAHLGVSVMLMDLVGVPKGSVGPYLGLSLLGLSYEMSESIYFVFDPADVALPAPKISGAPFTYWQYRLTVGMQFGA